MLTATRMAVLALVLTLPMAGCASRSFGAGSPSAMTSTQQVQTLVGRWDGWMTPTNGNTVPVQVTINPDGTYTSQMGATAGNGTFQVVDGKILTKGHLSGPAFGSDRQSVVRIVEKGGRPMLVGEGHSEVGPYSYELTKRN